MARSTRRSHRAPLRALTPAVVALGLAACSPIATQDVYSPSDGVRAELGEDIRAHNLLILTSAEGEEGVLLAGLTNLTDEETEVTVTVGSESFDFALGPRETLLLKGSGTGSTEPGNPEDGESPQEGGNPGNSNSTGQKSEEVLISSVPAPPGAVTDVTISTPGAGEVTVPVPVLDGTLEPYDQFVPGGSSAA